MTIRLTLAATAAAILATGAIGIQAQVNDVTAASGPARQAAALSSADRNFATAAALGGLAEVRLGELAQRKGASDHVKQFGAQMVQDHGKANEELKRVAIGKGLQLPTELDRKHADVQANLDKRSGAEFDREYIRVMLDAHKKDVALFERQARSGKDADLKAFAEKTLPTLRQHLTHVQGLKP